jgi:hypothetical protein
LVCILNIAEVGEGAALRLTGIEALAGLFCWWGVRINLRPNLTPMGLDAASTFGGASAVFVPIWLEESV